MPTTAGQLLLENSSCRSGTFCNQLRPLHGIPHISQHLYFFQVHRRLILVCFEHSVPHRDPWWPVYRPCPGGLSWSPSLVAAPVECPRTCWGRPPGPGCVGSAQNSWHHGAPSGSCVSRNCCWWTSGRPPAVRTMACLLLDSKEVLWRSGCVVVMWIPAPTL